MTAAGRFMTALLALAHDSNLHLGSKAEPCTIKAQARVKTCQGRETQLILHRLTVLGADGTEAAQPSDMHVEEREMPGLAECRT